MDKKAPTDNLLIVRKLMPHLWPRDNFFIKIRVTLSLIFLIVAKVSTVATPLFMIWAVDSLTGDLEITDKQILFGIGSIGLVISYGVMRVFSVAFNELRDGIFAMVGQRA